MKQNISIVGMIAIMIMLSICIGCSDKKHTDAKNTNAKQAETDHPAAAYTNVKDSETASTDAKNANAKQAETASTDVKNADDEFRAILAKAIMQSLVEGDPQTVAAMEETAEKGGDATACLLAGIGNLCLKEGKRNEYRAFYFLKKSAMAGNEIAMFYVGMMQCSGEGTTQDVVSGKKWLNESACRGCVDARNKLNEIQNIERRTANMKEAALLFKELIISAAEINNALQGNTRGN